MPNSPSGVAFISPTKFFQPPEQSAPAGNPVLDEEDGGWWGGVQQAGALIALAFALEASALSGNTAIAFQAQHQDEISRGSVIEEVYSYQDQKSLPVLDTSYPAYQAPHQDEISRGPVVDEVYSFQDQKSVPVLDTSYPAYQAPHQDEISRGAVVEEVYEYKFATYIESLQAAPYWFDANELQQQVAAFVPVEDYWFMQTYPPAEIFQNVFYFFDSGDAGYGAARQNYVSTGMHNYISQEIGEGIKS